MCGIDAYTWDCFWEGEENVDASDYVDDELALAWDECYNDDAE